MVVSSQEPFRLNNQVLTIVIFRFIRLCWVFIKPLEEAQVSDIYIRCIIFEDLFLPKGDVPAKR